MSEDIYGSAIKIAEKIENEGFSGFKKEIDDLILSGTTGTEIIMSLRWKFNVFLKQNPSDTISKDILNLISKINSIINEGTSGKGDWPN